MNLAAGAKLNTYEIIGLLGAGGMGEVYRARDLKLKREVAIKVLPDAFSLDQARLARFQREAEVLASLNHPHIASIHDLGESGALRFLVLELVEGETLADRLQRGPLPIEEALHIGKQIAEALEAAHEKGIIHRDLKPANIKITPDAKVKVLDFGLAKVFDAGDMTDMSKSPTLMSGSIGGVIMGTPAYLSPEQARGKFVDKRADIWAFGCVLHEMLTGHQAFSGETMSDVLASILTRDVDSRELPANMPAKLRDLMTRCLQKDSNRRLRDIGDARIEIEDMLADRTSPQLVNEAASTPKRASTLSLGLAAIVVVLIVAVAFLALRKTSTQAWTGDMIGGPSFAMGPRVSPDGRLVAFIAWVDGTSQAAVTTPESGDWTVLTHDRTRGYLSNVCWSRDGTKIYYGRIDGVPRGVFAVPALGGDEHLVLEDARGPEALSDGSLLVIRTNQNRKSQIFRFWPETAELKAYPALTRNNDFDVVRATRDGKEAFFWGRSVDQPASDPKNYVYSIELDSGTVRRIADLAGSGNQNALTGNFIGIAGTGLDDRTILTETKTGDLYNLVAIPRRGGAFQTLFSTTTGFYSVDVGPDRSIYVDQISRPSQILRLSGANPQSELVFASSTSVIDLPLPPIPDGRILVTKIIGGRRRLLIAKPGGDALPFLQTSEDTSGPTALLKNGEFAFVLGSGPTRKIAVGSLADGRIIRRFSKLGGASVASLAASPDGQTLYYVIRNSVWSVPASDGESRLVHQGDAVAVDPNGKYLLIELVEKDAVRLVRLPLDGTPEQPLSFPNARLAFITSPNAIRSDGVIVHTLAFGEFNWGLGLLHPDTGKVERLPVDPSFDVHFSGFLPDGRILISGFLFNSSIWRFKPIS